MQNIVLFIILVILVVFFDFISTARRHNPWVITLYSLLLLGSLAIVILPEFGITIPSPNELIVAAYINWIQPFFTL